MAPSEPDKDMSKSKRPAKARPAARPNQPPAAPGAPVRRTGPAVWIGLALLAIAIVAVTGYLWPGRVAVETVGNNRTVSNVVERVESLYNDIYVYRQPDGNFILSFGAKRLRYVESIVNPADELDLPVTYTQSMTAGLAYAGGLDDAAIIGLGGGRTAWYHHKSVPELRMTAVELDPEVARIAGQYFKVKPEPNFDIEIVDGRVYLARTDKRFDILLIDAYRGPFVPFHLLTVEFYKLVAAHLKPGGVAVQNVEPSTMLFDSAVATIKQAFAHVVFLQGEGNIVVLAYNGAEKDEAELRRVAAERQAKYGFRYDLVKILDRRFTPPWNEKATALSDDFAPVEFLKAITRYNEKQK
jgi:spermidine synthase